MSLLSCRQEGRKEWPTGQGKGKAEEKEEQDGGDTMWTIEDEIRERLCGLDNRNAVIQLVST